MIGLDLEAQPLKDIPHVADGDVEDGDEWDGAEGGGGGNLSWRLLRRGGEASSSGLSPHQGTRKTSWGHLPLPGHLRISLGHPSHQRAHCYFSLSGAYWEFQLETFPHFVAKHLQLTIKSRSVLGQLWWDWHLTAAGLHRHNQWRPCFDADPLTKTSKMHSKTLVNQPTDPGSNLKMLPS